MFPQQNVALKIIHRAMLHDVDSSIYKLFVENKIVSRFDTVNIRLLQNRLRNTVSHGKIVQESEVNFK